MAVRVQTEEMPRQRQTDEAEVITVSSREYKMAFSHNLLFLLLFICLFVFAKMI